MPSPWRKSGLTVHKEIFTQTKDPMTRSVLKAKTDYLNAQVAESQTESNCSLLQTLCLLNPKSIIFLQIFQLLSFHILSVIFFTEKIKQIRQNFDNTPPPHVPTVSARYSNTSCSAFTSIKKRGTQQSQEKRTENLRT